MKIRDVRLEDAARLLEIYGYYVENTVITFEYEVPSLEEFEGRIKNITEKYPYIVLEDNGIIYGYAYAGVFKARAAYDKSCELTIYLDKDSKKKGYGRALYEELEKRLAAMGIENLYACIGDPVIEDEYLTKNSEHFHEHLGFTKIGSFFKCGYKFGRWYNMIWMEKLIGKHNLKTVSIQLDDKADNFAGFASRASMSGFIHGDGFEHPGIIVLPGTECDDIAKEQVKDLAWKYHKLGYNAFGMNIEKSAGLTDDNDKLRLEYAKKAVDILKNNKEEYGVDPCNISILGLDEDDHVDGATCIENRADH